MSCRIDESSESIDPVRHSAQWGRVQPIPVFPMDAPRNHQPLRCDESGGSVGSGIVGVYDRGRAVLPGQRPQAQSVDFDAAALRIREQGGPGARQQPAFVTLGVKTLDQAQNLPLPAAHLKSGIDVENLHERVMTSPLQ